MTKNAAAIPSFLVGRFLKRSSHFTAVLTILFIAAAFINLLFVASLLNGIARGTDDQVINAYVGDATIRPLAGQRAIPQVGDALAQIRRIFDVVGVSAQTIVPATLKHGPTQVSREVLAIDPADEQTVTNIARKMVAGSFLRPMDLDGIVLGIQIAGGPGVELNETSLKGAQVGDTVLLSTYGAARAFTIRGIFKTKFLTADLRAFISRDAWERLDPEARDRATMILVKAKKRGRERALVDALRRTGVKGSFSTWQDSAGIMKSITKSFVSINVTLSFVGLFITAVTIFIVVYIDVMGRRRQIGVLRALGVEAWVVRLTYMLEAAVYAIAGLVLGLAIFLGVIVPIVAAHPFSLPLCDAVLSVDNQGLIIRGVAVLAVAIASGLVPALLATRLPILDAIVDR